MSGYCFHVGGTIHKTERISYGQLALASILVSGIVKSDSAMTYWGGGFQPISEDPLIAAGLESSSDEIISALEILGKGIMVRSPTVSFSVHAPRIVELISNPTDARVLERAIGCFRIAVESDGSLARRLVESNAIGPLVTIFNNFEFMDACEQCVHVLECVSRYFSAVIAPIISMDTFFRAFEDHFKNAERRKMMKLLENISSVGILNLESWIDKIVSISEEEDQKVAESALTVLANIWWAGDPLNVSTTTVTFITRRLPTFRQSDRRRFMLVLRKLLTTPVTVKQVIDANIDFEALVFGTGAEVQIMEDQRALANCILMLLPETPKFDVIGTVRGDRPPESVDFAHKVQPLLIRMLMERLLDEYSILLCLAATLEFCEYEPNDDFIMSLLGLESGGCLSLVILAVISHFGTSQKIKDSNIAMKLKLRPEDVNEPEEKWFTSTLKDLRCSLDSLAESVHETRPEHWTLASAAQMARDGNLSRLAFMFNGGIQWFGNIIVGSDPLTHSRDLETLIEFAYSMLSMVFLPVDWCEMMDISDFTAYLDKKASIVMNIGFRGQEDKLTHVDVKEQLGYIEGKLYRLMLGISPGDVAKMMYANPERSRYIDINLQEATPWSHLPVCYRAFTGSRSGRLYFEGGRTGGDTLVSVLCEDARDETVLLCRDLIVTETPSTYDLSFLTCTNSNPFNDLFELLKEIWKKYGYARIIDSFVSKAHARLANPFGSIGRMSSAVALMFHYPFLFPLAERILVFKLTMSDVYTALKHLMVQFGSLDDGAAQQLQRYKGPPLKLRLNRDALYADGLVLLEHFLNDRLPVQIKFAGDVGFGTGPTRQFFSMMAREFLRPERCLFRNSTRKGEFYADEKGLFPSVIATAEQFRLIGTFVAKAISLVVPLDLSFNPVFFDITRGVTVTCASVDDALTRSLKEKAGLFGLDFTYPGYPEMELVASGSEIIVDASNVDEYVRLVEDATIAGSVHQCAMAFKDGFNDVIPFNAMDLFTSEELSIIIQGDNGLFSSDDLQYVDLANGYTRESPEIVMLFEVILEMSACEQKAFTQFVTGCVSLPFGGLRMLEPHLTVAKVEGLGGLTSSAVLPTASTCIFMLKLPSYTSKAVMREKLLYAISEGANSFELT